MTESLKFLATADVLHVIAMSKLRIAFERMGVFFFIVQCSVESEFIGDFDKGSAEFHKSQLDDASSREIIR